MTCATCHKTTPVMVGMEPGRDGKPWWFCSACYRAGLATTDTTPAPAPRKGRR